MVDAQRRIPVASIPAGGRPWGLALHRDGTRLYTANGLTNDVSVIDTRRWKTMKTIKVGSRPCDVAVPH